MNYKMIRYILGTILKVEALLMCLPALVAFWYGEGDLLPFLVTILVASGLGLGLALKRPQNTVIYAREGFVITSLSWIVMSLVGALPFRLAGAIPHYIDAVFETVSGFTTTGATILTAIEGLPMGLLFWRSFTHWLGGMGVLVLTAALLPFLGISSNHLIRAESPGPVKSKLLPRASQSSKILYAIYLALTAVEAVLLWLAGLGWYDAVTHAMSTAGTGGFSRMNASVGAFGSPAVEIIITVFMLLFSVNFAVYFLILTGKARQALKSDELRFFLIMVALATAAIAWNIRDLYQGVGECVRYAAFQVASIVSTTGFSSANYDLWPEFSKMLLVVLTFIGACAGSTGGGIKVSRLMILLKSIKQETKRMLHPKAVTIVRVNGRKVSGETMNGVYIYFICYIMILLGSVLLVAFNNFDFGTTFSAVLTTLNNVGPGISLVGPVENFSQFSGLSKAVFCVDMLVGRLEIFPYLMLISPELWRRRF